jgi:hypothetical protein
MAAAAIAGTGATIYNNEKQRSAQKEAQRKQEAAQAAQEAALIEKGPEQLGINIEAAQALKNKRQQALLAGYANTIKTSRQGDLARVKTAQIGQIMPGQKTLLGQ